MPDSIHFSPSLADAGALVEGVGDIAQAIWIILNTPKGSDPLRPLFGSDLWRYIDAPLPQAVPHIIRESWDAISAWEPRAVVEKIEVTPEAGRATLAVTWRPVDGAQTEVTRV